SRPASGLLARTLLPPGWPRGRCVNSAPAPLLPAYQATAHWDERFRHRSFPPRWRIGRTGRWLLLRHHGRDPEGGIVSPALANRTAATGAARPAPPAVRAALPHHLHQPPSRVPRPLHRRLPPAPAPFPYPTRFRSSRPASGLLARTLLPPGWPW